METTGKEMFEEEMKNLAKKLSVKAALGKQQVSRTERDGLSPETVEGVNRARKMILEELYGPPTPEDND